MASTVKHTASSAISVDTRRRIFTSYVLPLLNGIVLQFIRRKNEAESQRSETQEETESV